MGSVRRHDDGWGWRISLPYNSFRSDFGQIVLSVRFRGSHRGIYFDWSGLKRVVRSWFE